MKINKRYLHFQYFVYMSSHISYSLNINLLMAWEMRLMGFTFLSFQQRHVKIFFSSISKYILGWRCIAKSFLWNSNEYNNEIWKLFSGRLCIRNGNEWKSNTSRFLFILLVNVISYKLLISKCIYYYHMMLQTYCTLASYRNSSFLKSFQNYMCIWIPRILSTSFNAIYLTRVHKI